MYYFAPVVVVGARNISVFYYFVGIKEFLRISV